MITAIKRLIFTFALISSFNTFLSCAQKPDEEKRRAQAMVNLVKSVKSYTTDDIESLTSQIQAQKEIRELIRVAGRENAEIILLNKEKIRIH